MSFTDFKQIQYQFAAHLRDPDQYAAPAGIEDRRLAIYRKLFFNNITGLLSQTYPVLYKIMGKTRWQTLCRQFYREHKAKTPLFTRLAKEFLDWLSNHYSLRSGDPAFLLELAHYEWAELALSLAPDPEFAFSIDPDGDLLTGVPVYSPVAWLLQYQFPVHKISPEFQPSTPSEQPTFLVVYRDSQDAVGFMLANPISAQLIQWLEQNRQQQQTGLALLETLAEQLPSIDKPQLIEGGTQILKQLREKDILLGTQA